MGYLIFFLIAMVIISIFPYLFQIVIGIWLISMVINLFAPRRPRNSQTFTQQQQRPREDEQQRPRPKGDVIDVEYTQRDADES